MTTPVPVHLVDELLLLTDAHHVLLAPRDGAGYAAFWTESAEGNHLCCDDASLTENIYDPATGLLTQTQSLSGTTVSAQVSRTYDTLGPYHRVR